MKKYIIIAIMALSLSLGGQAQHIVHIDTVLTPYFQFDYEDWLESDPFHKASLGSSYFCCYPGSPQVPLIRGGQATAILGDQLQYNYIEGGADVYGIAVWNPYYDTNNLEYYVQEDLFLYDALPDTFMLKATLPYTPGSNVNYFNTRFPTKWMQHGSGCVVPDFFGYNTQRNSAHFFDKPIHVTDSFYVGATQRGFANLMIHMHDGEGGHCPVPHRWGHIIVSNMGQFGDSTCWPRIKLKQRFTISNPFLYSLSIAAWNDSIPEGYILNQWVDRIAVDFCLIVPIIGHTDTLWDYELPDCPWVRWLNVTGVYDDTTVLRWDRFDDAHSQWQLAYGPKGIRPEDGTLVDCSRPSWRHIDSLHRGDTLVAWVRTVCNEYGYEYYSDWSDSVEWCGAEQQLWTERPNGNAVTDGMVRLSPNPANADVSVSSAYRLLGVEAYAMDGRAVYKADAHGLTHTFSVKGWPQGTYLIMVETASGIATKKLVVRP